MTDLTWSVLNISRIFFHRIFSTVCRRILCRISFGGFHMQGHILVLSYNGNEKHELILCSVERRNSDEMYKCSWVNDGHYRLKYLFKWNCEKKNVKWSSNWLTFQFSLKTCPITLCFPFKHLRNLPSRPLKSSAQCQGPAECDLLFPKNIRLGLRLGH